MQDLLWSTSWVILKLIYTCTLLIRVLNKFRAPKVKPWSQDCIAAGAYPGFCSMKQLEVFLLPLDGMLVHRRSFPHNLLGFPQQFAGTHFYTWVERGTVLWDSSVLPKNTTQCPQPGLEPGPLALESSTLTMRPPRLPLAPKREFIWEEGIKIQEIYSI